MPTSIAIVHDDETFLDKLGAALGGAGDEIRCYTTVMSALIGLDEQPPAELLITRMRFGPGGSNGVALAVMARRCNPKIKVLFIAPPEFKDDAAGLGTFLAMPASIPAILDAVDRLVRDQVMAHGGDL